MDARKLLEHLARYPPEPFADGCAKRALQPFLRTLQIAGSYHEDRYYEHFRTKKKLKQHYVNQVSSQNDDLMISKNIPVTFSSDQTTMTPQNKLFIRSYRDPDVGVSNVINSNQSNNLRRRDNISVSMTTIVTDSLCAADKTQTMGNLENMLELPPEASHPSSDSFLGECGIVDKHLTRDMIASLGYDMPGMVDVADKNESKERPFCFSFSCLKNLWSDRTYSFIFLLIHWANFLRCVMYINHDYQVAPLTALIPVLWFLMVAACNTAMFVSCLRRDHFYAFFSKWAAIYQDPVSRSVGLRGVLTSRFIKMSVVLQVAMTLCNLSCVIFIMLMDDSFSAGINCLFYVTGYRSPAVIAASVVVMAFTSATWIGNIAFIVIVCYFVQTHFKEFNQVLRLHVSAAGPEFPQALTLLRERHLAMCENVSVLDKFIRVTTGVSFSVYITLACLLLYQLVRVKMDVSIMVISVYWLVSCVLLTGISTYSMANVNVAMHAVSDDLYAIQTRHMTLDQFGQLQMFMTKVNGPNLGFTIFGLVVVTRELMLTLFGIYLTYGIVLLQFPEDAIPANPTPDDTASSYVNLTSTTAS